MKRMHTTGWTAAAMIGFALLAGCGAKAPEPQQAAGGTESPGAPAASPVEAAPAAAAPAAVPEPIRLPEGTTLRVRTTQALSTKTASAGEPFTATLAEPLLSGDRVVAPKGAAVTGVVAESDPGGRVKGVASLAVRLTRLKLPSGEEVEIHTSTLTRDAPASKKKDAVTVGIASGVGAAIGAVAGGGKGAAIGAAAGAGAGTGAVMATRGNPAVIGSESLLSFQLRSPVEIRP